MTPILNSEFKLRHTSGLQWRAAFVIRYHLIPGSHSDAFADCLMRLSPTRRHLISALALLAILCVPAVFAKNSTQIIVVPVANMYSGPTDQSDVVSQAIYGSNVTLLTARAEWCRIPTADHKKAWRPTPHLRPVHN